MNGKPTSVGLLLDDGTLALGRLYKGRIINLLLMRIQNKLIHHSFIMRISR